MTSKIDTAVTATSFTNTSGHQHDNGGLITRILPKLNWFERLLYIVIAVLAITTGCNDQSDWVAKKPLPIKNEANNLVTKREALVREFQTSDVVQVPYSDHEFIVKDTNSAIWFVYWDSDGDHNNGHTMLFKGNGGIAIPPSQVELETQQAANQVLFNLMSASAPAQASNFFRALSVLSTNAPGTNHVLMEDLEKK